MTNDAYLVSDKFPSFLFPKISVNGGIQQTELSH